MNQTLMEKSLQRFNTTQADRMKEGYLILCEEIGALKSKMTFAEIAEHKKELHKITFGKMNIDK